MRRTPAAASVMPATIIRAVPNLNAGMCAAASQKPAKQDQQKTDFSEAYSRRMLQS